MRLNMRPLTRSKLVLTLVTAFILSALPAIAQVYKSVDDSGKVTYTDQPKDNAETVDIKTPNSSQAVAVPEKTETLAEIEAVEGYDSVTISSPADNSIIANGLLPFSVIATANPALREGHTLQLKIDGQVHSTSAGSFAVENIHRGEHQFQVAVIDGNGQTVQQSAPVKVFAYRPGG